MKNPVTNVLAWGLIKAKHTKKNYSLKKYHFKKNANTTPFTFRKWEIMAYIRRRKC